MELSSRPAVRRRTITCSDSAVEQLEQLLLAHLNAHVQSVQGTGATTCAFLSGGSATCSSDSIKFQIVLTCAGGAATGNLIDNVEQQQMAITNIMARRTSEQFTADGVAIIVRLFRDSDRRNSPSPTCNEECSEVEQTPLMLCDCPCKLTIACVK